MRHSAADLGCVRSKFDKFTMVDPLGADQEEVSLLHPTAAVAGYAWKYIQKGAPIIEPVLGDWPAVRT